MQDGRLSIGGCDAVELAREFGTPAYVMAEDDLRARAREFRARAGDAPRRARRGHLRLQGVPGDGGAALFAEEGLGCDVASGGELHLALKAGFAPERIYLHGNAKSEEELRAAPSRPASAGSSSTTPRTSPSSSACCRRAARQRVLLRIRPGRRRRHARGDPHRPRRVQVRPRPARGARARAATRRRTSTCSGFHFHLGSQLVDPTPYRAAVGVLAGLGDQPRLQPRRRLRRRLHAPTTGRRGSTRPSPPWSRRRTTCSGPGKRLVIEPGRALVANAGVTLYTVESVKRLPGGAPDRRRRRRHVRQPAADALRRRLRRRASPTASARRASRRRRRQALRVRRRARPPHAAARRAARRRARHAGDRRLRPRDGLQLQRRCRARRSCSAPAARRAPSSAARPTRIWVPETFERRPARPRHRGLRVRDAARAARRGDRPDHRPAARAQRRAHPLARRLRGDPRRLAT